jgi:hypothetical protein
LKKYLNNERSGGGSGEGALSSRKDFTVMIYRYSNAVVAL